MADAFRLLPSPAYKISKAALNMLTVQYAKEYADDGFTFLGISPGVSHNFVHFRLVGQGFTLLLTPTVAPHRPWRLSSRSLGRNRC
jgi:NAD(P)-dependent dehydrogenase (short-subunit alcohol dehydrogenase family)